MKRTGQDYSDDNAYFIAGGRTLDLILKYEVDSKNADQILTSIAQEFGAVSAWRHGAFSAHQEITNPALTLEKKSNNGSFYAYNVNAQTPEGQALWARLQDVPGWTFSAFARRLTGSETVNVNPDGLDQKDFQGSEDAAFYRQYGGTYVVAVPRVIRGVFNDAAQALTAEYGFNKPGLRMSDGYRYEWFTPLDSTPIPYSKVLALQEKQMGNQLTPREITGVPLVSDIPPRP